MEYVKCNICGVDDTRLWAKKDGMDIVRCKRCGLIYTNPRPDAAELDDYYNKEYFSAGNYTADEQRHRMYLIEIRQMLGIIPNKGRFLDVGAAQGKFLSLLPATFEKYGIEFSGSAARDASRLYGLDVKTGELSQAKYGESFFDVVHFRGAFEHLRDPLADLFESRRILKDDGWLIISTTPNIAGPAGRYYKEGFRLCMPREHIYYFSPATLDRILSKSGFTAKRRFYPYLNTPYADLFGDILSFFANKMRGMQSPPFFGSVLTVYARKAI